MTAPSIPDRDASGSFSGNKPRTPEDQYEQPRDEVGWYRFETLHAHDPGESTPIPTDPWSPVDAASARLSRRRGLARGRAGQFDHLLRRPLAPHSTPSANGKARDPACPLRIPSGAQADMTGTPAPMVKQAFRSTPTRLSLGTNSERVGQARAHARFRQAKRQRGVLRATRSDVATEAGAMWESVTLGWTPARRYGAASGR